MANPTTATANETDLAGVSHSPGGARAQHDRQVVDKLLATGTVYSLLNALEHPHLRNGEADLLKGLGVRGLTELHGRIEAEPASQGLVKGSVQQAMIDARELSELKQAMSEGRGNMSLKDLGAYIRERMERIEAAIPGVLGPESSLRSLARLEERIGAVTQGALPVKQLEAFVIRDAADAAHLERLSSLGKAGVSVPSSWVDPRAAHNGEVIELSMKALEERRHPKWIAEHIMNLRDIERLKDVIMARDPHYTDRQELDFKVKEIVGFTSHPGTLSGPGMDFVRRLIFLSQPNGCPHQNVAVDGIDRLFRATSECFIKDQTRRPFSTEEREHAVTRQSIMDDLTGHFAEAAGAIALMQSGNIITGLSVTHINNQRLQSNHRGGHAREGSGTKREFDITMIDTDGRQVALEVKNTFRALFRKNGRIDFDRSGDYTFTPNLGDRLQILAHQNLATANGFTPGIYVHTLDQRDVEAKRRGAGSVMDVSSKLDENMKILMTAVADRTGGCPAVYCPSPRNPSMVQEVWVENGVL